MNKFTRTSVAALAASLAIVAVGVTPAFATKAPNKAAVIANSTAILTAPTTQIQMGGSSFDANLVNQVYSVWTPLGTNNAASIGAYQSSKSGTGRANVIAGTFGIGFSDVPLNYAGQDTSDTTQYVQIPVALGGVAIISNLAFQTSDTVTNSFGTATTPTLTSNGLTSGVAAGKSCAQELVVKPLTIPGATLAGIYAGKVTSWNNAALVAANAKLTVKALTPVAAAVGTVGKKGYKAQKNKLEAVNCLALLTTPTIIVSGRTAGSGTTFMFSDYLNQVDATDFPNPSSAQMPGVTLAESGSAAVASDVAGKPGAIGYVEWSYAKQNSLAADRLISGAGAPVTLSDKTVTSAASNGLKAIAANTACPTGFSLDGPTTYSAAGVNTQCFSIANVDVKSAYPIAGFSYAIAPKTIADDTSAIATTKFLIYLSQSGKAPLSYGQNQAASQFYVPLPTPVQKYAYNTISQINGGADISATN